MIQAVTFYTLVGGHLTPKKVFFESPGGSNHVLKKKHKNFKPIGFSDFPIHGTLNLPTGIP